MLIDLLFNLLILNKTTNNHKDRMRLKAKFERKKQSKIQKMVQVNACLCFVQSTQTIMPSQK